MRRSIDLSRALRLAAVVTSWAVTSWIVPVGPAAAQEPPPTPPPSAPTTTSTTLPASATDPTTIGDDRVRPEILGVAVQSPEYDVALVRYQTIAAQLDQTRATYDHALVALVELDALEIRLRRELAGATERHAAASTEVARFQGAIEELAVATYVLGTPSGEVVDATDWRDATDEEVRRAVTDTVLRNQIAELARASDERDRAARDRDRARALLDSVSTRRDETIFVRDSSQAAAFVLTSELEEQRQEVADTRLTAAVVGADFTFVTLDAYVRAALVLAAEQPACGIRWEVLAGIGRTESRHGHYGGSDVEADGTVEPPIVGIPLDGTNGTARVGDTDGGQWDGDPAFDRAVGPMQFIPGTWRFYGRDANLDGDIDPHDIYDAAEAAARLLCRNSTAYDTDAGLERGLLSYNQSLEYVRVVAAYIKGYDDIELF
jgi:membrane-bound lytic murein transglycosylase B